MTIQFQLGFEDLLAMQKNVIHQSRTHNVKEKYFRWGISILLLAIVFFIKPSLIGLIIGLVIAGVFFLVAPAVYPKIAFARLKSKFEQNDHGNLLKPCEMHFSEDGIDRIIEGETTHFPWNGFRKLTEDDTHYFLYVDDLQGIIIPKEPTVKTGNSDTFQEKLVAYANTYLNEENSAE
ncbi:MAG TPA: YcxB family protein [Bacillota bacterium]|nr:YcxB family protein [Bacillota bacterium]